MSQTIHTMPSRVHVEERSLHVQQRFAAHLQTDVLRRVGHVIQTGSQWLAVMLALRGIVGFIAAGHPNRLSAVLNFFTSPFVAPFHILLQEDPTNIIEVSTGVALIFYACLGWMAATLLKALYRMSLGQYWHQG